MDITVKDIYEAINSFAPFILQESWDNSGLQIGDLGDKVRNPIICLDITYELVRTAIKDNSNLIISHHPLFFKPIICINRSNNLINDLINYNINVISTHTNLDVIPQGVSFCLASKIGLQECKILSPLKEQKFYKVSFFITEDKAEEILDNILTEGVGEFLKYKNCAFTSKGIGQFRVKKKAKPYIDKERFNENKVEFIVRKDKINECISKLKDIHPYDEIAFDVFEECINPLELGYGVIGKYKVSKKLHVVLKEVKELLGIDKIKFKGDLNKKINSIALCGGSGGAFIPDALKKGADLYITGDLKYHEVLEYADKIALADVGHRASEIPVLDILKKELESKFKKLVFRVFVENKDFYNYV